jgi:hypothetical protein
MGGAEYGYGSNYAYGYYVMPYYLSFNNAPPTAVICDDFNHTVYLGEHWTGTVSTFADLSKTRFGIAYETQYHEAAWIASQIMSSSSLATIAAAQFAIWKLFSGNTPLVSGESAWLTAAANAAAHNFYGMDFSHWQILTPLSSTGPQEYFFYIPSIPEPAAVLDLMIGMLAFGGLWIRKRHAAVAQRATNRL